MMFLMKTPNEVAALVVKTGLNVSVLVRHGLVSEDVQSRPYRRANRRCEWVLVNAHVRVYALTATGRAAL